MRVVSMEDLKPGMILVSDLRTSKGRLILPTGHRLTEERIKIARIWGITEAKVEGPPVDEEDLDLFACFDPDVTSVLQAMVNWRFAGCDRNFQVHKKLEWLFTKKITQGLDRKNARKVVEKYRGRDDHLKKLICHEPEKKKIDMESLVKREVELVSLPDVFYEIMEVVKSPVSSAAHIAEVISKDTSLSSRMLKLVNSTFYSFISRIDTLSRAVTIVGTVEITNLAMGISVTSMFDDIPEDIVNVNDFWEHSIAVGVLARILAAEAGMPDTERVFVGGLLHDIGRMVLIKHHPDVCAGILLAAAEQPVPLYQLERKHTGFTHADLGEALLKEWNIPPTLADILARHHARSWDNLDEALLVQIADSIAHGMGFGHSGSRRVTPIDKEAWQVTGLKPSVLTKVVSQTSNQLRDLMQIIVPGSGDEG
ncbi:HDOD domain-containing protein [Desulfonatronovibrio magnus]|uniref:HDOD domain-containing protein n=1 Tax=Desulfonatronovibrio magnus TaxID=698827 RepID=UPI0005EB1CDE|nr:HDOD domain-containing protein [Desulfonatronovibrio magnus]